MFRFHISIWEGVISGDKRDMLKVSISDNMFNYVISRGIIVLTIEQFT